jgi:hypothetical protein
LKLGDVISVDRDSGLFTLEGTSASILDVAVEEPRPPQKVGGNHHWQSGSNTAVRIRAKGEASAYYPDLPHALAGIDLHFEEADAVVLAIINQRITAIEELDRFRQAILNSYHSRVWQPHWALVTSVAMVDRFTLIASTGRNANVALSASGEVDPNAPLELNLTAGISISAANQELRHSIQSTPSVPFCTGLRVRDIWFRDPATGPLGTTRDEPDQNDVWEDVDTFGA